MFIYLFKELFRKVAPYITKKTTHLRQPISAEEKLAVTLRYLATGETFESLMYQYRIHRSTISQFIPTVCQAIYFTLKDEYLKLPSTAEEWLQVVDQTTDRGNFQIVLGPLMGNTSNCCIQKTVVLSFTTTRDFSALF